MADPAKRPALTLIKNSGPAANGPRPFNHGSAIVLEARNGRLSQNMVRLNNRDDATALISGLVMALVQAIQTQQGF